MKKTLIGITLALFALAGNLSAIVLTTSDSYYVGSITKGLPSSESNEETWVNELLAMSLNSIADSSIDQPGPSGFNQLNRSGNVIPVGTATWADKQEDASNNVVGADTAFVLGKYGQGQDAIQSILVWYVGSLEVGTLLDLSDAASGLSHTSRLDGERTSVPDSGTTLALLGAALLGVISFRRFKK